MPRYHAAIRRGYELMSRSGFRLNAVKRASDLGNLAFGEGISPDEVERCFAQGVTVCTNNIDVGDAGLAEYVRQIKRDMCYSGRVRFNCYFSPDGSGADTHFDARIATTLQIEGRKRWRFARAAQLDWPPSNAQVRDGRGVWMGVGIGDEPWAELGPVDTDSFAEVVLEPGDVLCIPAGTWHNVKAIGTSLSLNLAFEPFDFYGVLVRMLDTTFRSYASWRGSLPPVDIASVQQGALPPEIRAHIAARMNELRAFLDQLDLDAPEVRDLWWRLGSHQGQARDQPRDIRARMRDKPRGGKVPPSSIP